MNAIIHSRSLPFYCKSAVFAALALLGATVGPVEASEDIRFDLTPSGGVRQCLPNARGEVSIDAGESAELMSVKVEGLPANTAFDVFVIQVPNLPFGLSWYQGDLTTNAKGKGKARFVGRFNIETFIVAPNVAPAPVVHETPIPDADANPPTGPVHTYHLGLWFNSPADARAAGCADTVTPFNGEHNAGIQVLNTGSFPDDQGPLAQLRP
ncbi:MAG: hypothetical protein IPP10_17145 [Candidatus Competibacteraceae bacterium]|nr:hypothetical protein [Candidatus Competibacteraceae bacterium]MBK8895841.1 hypothetical protein [Candidatus Competibacteraceae bacterium]MBK8962933.1 hypothetical protein [Candidatus Competibacteraceae bacterium]MBK9953132.1 hypothetical protein [Candidatus Competibacteraceae bacterium]